jgi:hypothetical protein
MKRTLEQEFQRELDDSRIARRRDRPKSRSTYHGVGRSKRRRVRHVERFGADFGATVNALVLIH